MKLLVIGASRGTGALLTQQALDQGHQVTAFARSAAQLAVTHPQLIKVSGDFHDANSVDAAVAGHDAVVITASLTMGQHRRHPHFYTTGTARVLEAMKRHRVPQVVILSNFEAGDGAALLGPLEQLFNYLFIRAATADHSRQEEMVRASGLQWSVARPTRLTDGPARGKYQALIGARVPGSISRADLAAFLLQAATTDKWLGKTVNVGG